MGNFYVPCMCELWTNFLAHELSHIKFHGQVSWPMNSTMSSSIDKFPGPWTRHYEIPWKNFMVYPAFLSWLFHLYLSMIGVSWAAYNSWLSHPRKVKFSQVFSLVTSMKVLRTFSRSFFLYFIAYTTVVKWWNLAISEEEIKARIQYDHCLFEGLFPGLPHLCSQ